MAYSPKKLMALLEKKGFELRRINGGHHIYFHKDLNKTVEVPVHGNEDIPNGVFAILEQAGISQEEF